MKKGLHFIILFLLFTICVKTMDLQLVHETNTYVGFATLNQWMHQLTGVNMYLYTMTDWLSLIPLLICLCFGLLGFIQWIQRKSLWRVDIDLWLLGCFYVVVILTFILFEFIPINYRPILIEGQLEVSYPSSTTLLVLTVMSTCSYQCNKRIKNMKIQKCVCLLSNLFAVFMILFRLVSGVHWITDIIASILLSLGLFYIYKGMVEHGVWEKVTGAKKK